MLASLACFLISKSDGLSIRLSCHSPSVANFTSRINASSQVRISQCWYFRTREVPTPDSQPGWDMTGQDCHDNGFPWPIYHGSGTWRQDRMGNGTWRDMAGHDECKKVAAVTRRQGGGGSANGKSRLWEQISKRRALPQLRDPTLTALPTQTRDIDFELVIFRTSFKVPGLRLRHGHKGRSCLAWKCEPLTQAS